MFHEYDIWLMIIPAAFLTLYVVDLIKPVGIMPFVAVVSLMFPLNIYLIDIVIVFLRGK